MRIGLQIQSTNYTSDNIRPQISLDKDPPHLDIITPKPTNLVVSAGGPHDVSEVLFTMEHGLKYQPKVLVYYYATLSDGSRYGLGQLYYGYGLINDYLYYESTDTTFTIKHKLIDYTESQNYTSDAGSHELRIKYMIFSIPENKLVSATND